MKKLILLNLIMLAAMYSFAQNRIVDFNDIKAKSADPGEIITITPDSEGVSVSVKITNVTDKNDLEKNYKFLFSGNIMDVKNALGGKYTAATNTYTLDLDTPIANNDKSTVFAIQKDDQDVYTINIKYDSADDTEIDGVEAAGASLSHAKVIEGFQNLFEKELLPNMKNELKLKEKDGAYIDEQNVIHMFVDHYGNFYGRGIPTVATEKNFFQFHVLTTMEEVNNNAFSFKYTGSYTPTFNIMNTTESGVKLQNSEGEEDDRYEIIVLNGAIKGPYTESFKAEITKQLRADRKQKENIVDAEITIAKLYHVSISTGLIGTTLKNPKNIEIMELANGDTTLIADDPGVRGVVTIMATFYPKGRSFLFPPSGNFFDPSRIGIQVGAQLSDELAENFFLGLSQDFARGGSLSIGAHFGRRHYVAGMRDFDFGKDVFDLPSLNVKQEWDVGFYFGVVIDTRVAIQLLKSLGTGS